MRFNIIIFLPFVTWLRDWHTKYFWNRCSYRREMCKEEKTDLYLNQGQRKSHLPRKLRFHIIIFLPFVAWLWEWHTKYLLNRCSYIRVMCKEKNQTSILIRDTKNCISPKLFVAYFYQTSIKIRGRKNAFPPNCRWRTDMRTKICKYRVALLLKTERWHINN